MSPNQQVLRCPNMFHRQTLSTIKLYGHKQNLPLNYTHINKITTVSHIFSGHVCYCWITGFCRTWLNPWQWVHYREVAKSTMSYLLFNFRQYFHQLMFQQSLFRRICVGVLLVCYYSWIETYYEIIKHLLHNNSIVLRDCYLLPFPKIVQ